MDGYDEQRNLENSQGQGLFYFLDEKVCYRNGITCIKESPWGELWIGTYAGLARYNKAKDSFVWYTLEDGLPGLVGDSDGIRWQGDVGRYGQWPFVF
ncbi:MAG: hypothetical protein QM762_30230 [Chryseolinea sp.]